MLNQDKRKPGLRRDPREELLKDLQTSSRGSDGD